MPAQFISRVAGRSGGFIAVKVVDPTPATHAAWNQRVQPYVQRSREFRFDRHWNWQRLLAFHRLQESLIGGASVRPACEVLALHLVAQLGNGEAFPVGQLLLAAGFPFVKDWAQPSVFIWYLAGAPPAALRAAGLPDDLALLRPLVDIGVQESIARGYEGRVCLHATRSWWNLRANRALYRRYEHIGMKPLRGSLMASLGRPNTRRYFYLDEGAALDFADRLDYLR